MNSWKVQHVLPLVSKEVCPCGETTALAGESQLLMYDPQRQEILWALNYRRQGPYDNHQPVYRCGNLISTYLVDEKEDLAWLYALHSQTGQLVWKEKIPARALMGRNRTDNYLVATENFVFYTQRKDGFAFLRDAESGVLKGQFPGLNVDQMAANSRYIALFEWHSGGILLLDTTQEKPSFDSHHLGKWLVDFTLDEDHLFALVIEEKEDSRSLHLRQYKLLGMELIQDFTFSNELDEPKIVRVWEGKTAILESRDALHAVNLQTGELIWSIETEDSPSYVVVTANGIGLFPFMGDLTMLSMETGGVTYSMEEEGWQYPFHRIGNDVLCEGSWVEIESLKNPDVSERTLWLSWTSEEPSQIGEPEVTKTFDLMTVLGASAPRKEILATELQNGKEQLATDGNWEAFFTTLCKVFEIEGIHPDVKDFLQELHAKDHLSGAIGVSNFDRVVGGFTFDSLWSVGPDNRFFPGLLIASESGGHYFYTDLESGSLICVHHDDNYDWANQWESYLEQENFRGFTHAMFNNPLFTLKAWRQFDTGFGDLTQSALRQLEEEDPKAFFQLLQQASGWSYEKLYDKMWDHELSVLTYGDDNYELLQEMVD